MTVGSETTAGIGGDGIEGDFLAGAFRRGDGPAIASVDPATGERVAAVGTSPGHVAEAFDAAAAAAPGWRALGPAARRDALRRVRAALAERRDAIAEAIRREVGKVEREAQAEVGSLLARFDLIADRIAADLRDGPLPGHPREALVHQPHGVVGVVGPFNFPLHLCHAHVVPALLLGNTVVMKPSEVAPLSARRYAEAFAAAELPPGVFNLVQGRGDAGAALVAHPALRALAFTGSWPTGRRILEALLDRPEVLVALEMGGKNVSIVCADADLRQAAHEIVVGGYLTTGQRCTCTDRVLVDRRVADALAGHVAALVRSLRLGDPRDPASFAGPLATDAGRRKLLDALAAARAAGVEEIARGHASDAGPGFVAPTLHRLPDGVHEVPGYTDVELFGPDVGVEAFDDEDHALALLDGAEGGLAYSVFSRDRARFERFVGRVHTGILNWNRSTNQASPRLPFGGVGKAGNFRPAGAYAPRNLAIPVAVQSNAPGAFTANPRLVPHLPPPDLDALDARHAEEERDEAARRLVDAPRPLRVERPAGGALPDSEAWLERLYAGDRIVREKKPGVFDALRSVGPWFVSVDEPPLSVRDGMSQTATIPGGLADDRVVRALVEGGFGDTLVRAGDPAAAPHPAADAFAATLRALVPGVPHVSFVNGGSESMEKALALCHGHAADPARQRRVLAFEGSFHGRTLLSLAASHNPAKRAPFEIAGHEAVFAPFPTWWEPNLDEPEAPEGYLALIAEGRLGEARSRWGWTGQVVRDAGRDCLLADEIASLAFVDATLRRGETFAVAAEPMQSEGGDRYGTARFFRALRLLTRFHRVPLVMDEVQTGFGLGGPFAWHTSFGLVGPDGGPDVPDCVTFAKRAQVGVVMSRFTDPEPTSSHPASLVRGRLHAEAVADPAGVEHARAIEARCAERLAETAERFPDLVRFPRNRGYALAFDLPSPAHLPPYLAQRFWRGAIVFGAGDRTVRHRLARSWRLDDVDALFDAVHESLAWLVAAPGVAPPAWMDLPQAAAPPRATPGSRPLVAARAEGARPETRVRRVRGAERAATLPAIVELEARVYEPARRDPEARLRLAFDDPHGVALVAEVRAGGPDGGAGGDGWHFAGYALAAPVEAVPDVPGVDRDPFLGRADSLYSLALTVDPAYQGLGLGRALKTAQVREAAAERREDGTPRYRHLTARNRVGHTDAMAHVARALGAYEVARLEGQYGDPEGVASYYRLPLQGFGVDAAPDPAATAPGDPARDWRGAVASPLATPPATLVEAARDGRLLGPAASKITLCNYVTPQVVRAVEHVAALAPALPHLYLTSSRDETFDKSLRALRVHRTAAQVAIGLDGGYLGHTTAAARSLSDPAVHRGGPVYYTGFRRVPHPADAGAEASLAALRATVRDAGGPDAVLGVWIEPVQERTGRTLDPAFVDGLAAFREETGVPVVLAETASAGYRSGAGPFASSAWGLVPDALTWWGGGQIGLVHVAPRWFVAKPLTLVSTWDGDELSLVRLHHRLRAARRLDVAARAARLDDALAPAAARRLSVRGAGLYRVVAPGGLATALDRALGEAGLTLPFTPAGDLVVAPPLDVPDDALEALAGVFRDVCR